MQLPGFVKIFLFLLFSGIYYLHLDNFAHTNILFLSACLSFLWFNRRHPNIITWILIIMLTRVFEILVLNNMAFVLESTTGLLLYDMPYAHYMIQIGFDLLAVYLINKRWYLYFRFYPGARKEDAYFTNADFFLIVVYLLYALVGISSIIETLVRNPQDIFLPANWARKDIDFVYENFELFKGILSLAVFALLWGSITEYFRKSGKFLKS